MSGFFLRSFARSSAVRNFTAAVELRGAVQLR